MENTSNLHLEYLQLDSSIILKLLTFLIQGISLRFDIDSCINSKFIKSKKFSHLQTSPNLSNYTKATNNHPFSLNPCIFTLAI